MPTFSSLPRGLSLDMRVRGRPSDRQKNKQTDETGTREEEGRWRKEEDDMHVQDQNPSYALHYSLQLLRVGLRVSIGWSTPDWMNWLE